MLSSFTSRAYFTESAFASALNFSGVPPPDSSEPLTKFAARFGSANDFSIAALSVATIAGGVPAGAKVAHRLVRPLRLRDRRPRQLRQYLAATIGAVVR